MGPLSSPRERGPDPIVPQPPYPEVGADIPTINCGRSVDAKRLLLRIYVIVAVRPHASRAAEARMLRFASCLLQFHISKDELLQIKATDWADALIAAWSPLPSVVRTQDPTSMRGATMILRAVTFTKR
jgi:hypothetical protein